MEDRRNIMEKILRNSVGEDFQKVFSDIMVLCEEKFIRTDAYGNVGDRKNDGFIKESGIFFQVYGPEENTPNQKNAIFKMKKDFKELIKICSEEKGWETVKKCIFVYNDKKKGITPPLFDAAKIIERDFQIEVDIWGIDQILKKFDLLKDEERHSIINNNHYILKISEGFHNNSSNRFRMNLFMNCFINFISYLMSQDILFGKGIPLKILDTIYYDENISLKNLLIKWETFDKTFFYRDDLESIYKELKENFLRLMEILEYYYYYREENDRLVCHYFDESRPIFKEISQLDENIGLNSHQIYMNRIKEVEKISYVLRISFKELMEKRKELDFNSGY